MGENKIIGDCVRGNQAFVIETDLRYIWAINIADGCRDHTTAQPQLPRVLCLAEVIFEYLDDREASNPCSEEDDLLDTRYSTLYFTYGLTEQKHYTAELEPSCRC